MRLYNLPRSETQKAQGKADKMLAATTSSSASSSSVAGKSSAPGDTTLLTEPLAAELVADETGLPPINAAGGGRVGAGSLAEGSKRKVGALGGVEDSQVRKQPHAGGGGSGAQTTR